MTTTLFLSLALLLGSMVGAQAGCVNKTIQLVNETETDRDVNGTVRYCFSNEWRTLCRGDKWQAREAIVTCRQLGYEGGKPWKSPRVQEDKGFRLAQNCDSTENSIEECGGIKEAHDGCSPDSHGALECLFANCNDQDVRLVGGSTNRQGRVEVCMNGRWGTVCNSSQEGIEEAVCSKLGFPGRGANVTEPVFVSAGAPIHRCNVTKDLVYMHCAPASNETCDHTADLWVLCRAHSEVTSIQNGVICVHNCTTTSETCVQIGTSATCATCVQNCTISETCSAPYETCIQPSTIGTLGAIIGVLVALQAVTLTILGIVIFHKKCSKQSSQGHTTESHTFTQSTNEMSDISRHLQSNCHVRVDSDQEPNEGSDAQDLTQQDKPQKPRPCLVALEMKPPSKMGDWKVTSEAGTEGDDFNDAEAYADPDAFMNKDGKNNIQSQEQTEAYPYSTQHEVKSGRGSDDFYEAEKHTYSVVDVKAKKKARHQMRSSPEYTD